MRSFSMQHSWVSLELLGSSVAAELVESIPEKWRSHFGIGRWIILDEPERAELQEASTRPIALMVPASEVLLRQIDLPLIPWFQLPNLMKYEASRHVPIPLDQARLDFRIVSRDVAASKMRIELAIIRADAIDLLCGKAQQAGIMIDAVAIDTKTGIWIARRPLQLNWRQTWLNERLRHVWLSIAIPVFLAILFILATQNWAARIAEDRDVDVAIARSQAVGIEPLRQQLSVLNDKISFLQTVRQRPSTAAIIDEVAKLLPDDSWLQELDIEDRTVQLRGIALHATDLLRIFSASPMFSNVQFEAPLTQAEGASGQQFDITMNHQ